MPTESLRETVCRPASDSPLSLSVSYYLSLSLIITVSAAISECLCCHFFLFLSHSKLWSYASDKANAIHGGPWLHTSFCHLPVCLFVSTSLTHYLSLNLSLTQHLCLP